MPLYRIERSIGTVSDEELATAAYRAISCIPHFDGMAWVRSYYDRPGGNITCYYEARDADEIRKHATMSHIPCDSVIEVAEILPNSYR